jgi:hypothetical protein
MNRLQAELQRLYAPGERALVMASPGPGSWERLGAVWLGVQADFQLPAPGISVSGEGFRLWFSLAQPLPAERALAFLEGLRRRYLAGVPPERIAMEHAPAGAAPPLEVAPGRWTAFVAPDLAALFADEPWLDIAPSADAQADLLARLQSLPVADVERAIDTLTAAAPAPATQSVPRQDARRFLLSVMNDPAIDLALRIEAAKALLPFERRE